MDRGAWWATVHGVAKSWTQLVSCSSPGSSVHGISQARILGNKELLMVKNGGFHFLLQGIFLIQGSNPGLLHCRQILYHLNHQESITKEL